MMGWIPLLVPEYYLEDVYWSEKERLHTEAGVRDGDKTRLDWESEPVVAYRQSPCSTDVKKRQQTRLLLATTCNYTISFLIIFYSHSTYYAP